MQAKQDEATKILLESGAKVDIQNSVFFFLNVDKHSNEFFFISLFPGWDNSSNSCRSLGSS